MSGGGEDREEARIVSKRGSRGSERAYITSENGKGLATHGGRAERAGRARSVKGTWCGIESRFIGPKNRFTWKGCLSRKDIKYTLGYAFSLERSVGGGDVESDIRCLICRYQVYADIRWAQNSINIHLSCLAALATFIHHVQIALKLVS